MNMVISIHPNAME